MKTPEQHKAVARLRNTLLEAAQHEQDVRDLTRRMDGDQSHLEFMGVRLPSSDQQVTALGSWLAKADLFLRS